MFVFAPQQYIGEFPGHEPDRLMENLSKFFPDISVFRAVSQIDLWKTPPCKFYQCLFSFASGLDPDRLLENPSSNWSDS